MGRPADRVIDEALSLPAETRLDLVQQLLRSLNLPLSEDIDRLWRQEAERRVAEIESGQIKVAEADEVYSRIRGKHAK